MRNLKFLTVFMLTICGLIACAFSEDDASNADELSEEEGSHFDIKFEMNESQNEQYSLAFTVEIDSGYYFVSPYSDGHHQWLRFSIENTDSLLLNSDLTEFPLTFETFDDRSDKKGRFARKSTKYTQRLRINSQNDFEVMGMIWFELLPINQPYEVYFIISHSHGRLTIDKSKTTTSNYPTFWDLKRVD